MPLTTQPYINVAFFLLENGQKSRREPDFRRPRLLLLTVDEDLLPGDVAPVPGEGQRELLCGGQVLGLEQRRHDHLG